MTRSTPVEKWGFPEGQKICSVVAGKVGSPTGGEDPRGSRTRSVVAVQLGRA